MQLNTWQGYNTLASTAECTIQIYMPDVCIPTIQGSICTQTAGKHHPFFSGWGCAFVDCYAITSGVASSNVDKHRSVSLYASLAAVFRLCTSSQKTTLVLVLVLKSYTVTQNTTQYDTFLTYVQPERTIQQHIFV